MNARLGVLIVSLISLASLLPSAGAHVANLPQGNSLAIGPYNLDYTLRPDPPFTDTPVGVAVRLYDRDTFALVENVPVSVAIGGPEEVPRQRLNPDGAGYLLASFTPHARGNYTLRFIVDHPEGPITGDVEIEVFPNLPVRLRAVDPNVDVIAGESTALAIELINSSTLLRETAGFADLSVRAEYWGLSHAQLLDQEMIEARQISSGVFRIDHVFERGGMYHLRFASQDGGFNYADVPLLHIDAAPPTSSSDEGKATPLPGLGLLLLVAFALALIRRTR